jgi:hypothetical protein
MTGVGCIDIKDLDAADVDLLGQIVARSYHTHRRQLQRNGPRKGEPPPDRQGAFDGSWTRLQARIEQAWPNALRRLPAPNRQDSEADCD